MNKKELWKDIPNYEGYYQASNLGRVKSLDRRVKVKSSNKYHKRDYKGIILKPVISSSGYYMVNLIKNGKTNTDYIHSIVIETWKGSSDLTVNHIDGNRLNNEITNLEYCSLSYNMLHAYSIGLKNADHKKKEIISWTKDTEDVYYRSIKEASKQLGINQQQISEVVTKRNKTTKGYRFRYVGEERPEETYYDKYAIPVVSKHRDGIEKTFNTIDEAAEYIGTTKYQVWKALHKKIPHVRYWYIDHR